MNAFQVDDMTCGHCAGKIRHAVSELDPQAQVRVELSTHRVEVESAHASGAQIEDAIRQAGYTPVPSAAAAAAPGTKPRGGCCCS